VEVAEKLQRARELDTREQDLWRETVELMESCWGMMKGEEGMGHRLVDLYSSLAVLTGPIKPRNLLLALCSSNLCSLFTLQNNLLEASHWHIQAKHHSQGLPYLGLSAWIDQFSPASFQKPITPSKPSTSRLGKGSPPKEPAAIKPTPSFARLLLHSATNPPSIKRPFGKRRKTAQADDYSQIERLLKHPIAPRPKPSITEISSEFIEDKKADFTLDERLNKTEHRETKGQLSVNRETAALRIQRQWGEYRAGKRLNREKAAARIQIWYRTHIAHIRAQARGCVRSLARKLALKTLRIAAKTIQSSHKSDNFALIIQSWFRQKLGLVALWMELGGKKALESTSDYPLSISTKPETLTSSFSESRIDFLDQFPTDRRRKGTEMLRDKAVLVIQKAYKGYCTRIQYVRLREVVVKLQAWGRGRAAYRQYLRVRRAVLGVQALWRGHLARREMAQRRARIVQIQAFYRGWKARKTLRKQVSAILCIQYYIRRHFSAHSISFRQ
jgi:hypothetical protein